MSAYIIDTGLITPLGIGVQTAYDGMLAGACAVRELTRFDTGELEQVRGGQLAEDDEEMLYSYNQGDENVALAMILHVAGQALDGLDDGPAPALVLATNFGLMETLEWCWSERHETGCLDPNSFRMQQDVVDTIVQRLELSQPAAQVSLSCASGAAAAGIGLDWLRNGRAERVLVVAYDTLTQFCWSGLANMRTISTDRVRPFDSARSGTIFSDGAAAVLFSNRPEDAASAIGVLHGTATNNNAFHLTAPAKGGDGSRRVMAAALQDASLTAADIGLVSAHATSTVANDVTESVAINAVLGEHAADVPVAAFKSNLGHLFGAASLAEMILALHSIRVGKVPPILNLEDQDDACNINAIRQAAVIGSDTVALINSAGIGGNNAAAIVSARTGQLPPMPARSGRVRMVSAGWVLAGSAGADTALSADGGWMKGNGLDDYKPQLESVKGYLDPSCRFALGAAQLCLSNAAADTPASEAFGIVAATEYGAPQTGYAFYQGLLDKGPRAASPMLFPYSYPNTVANLVAIEFGLAGSHMVFSSLADCSEAVHFAESALRSGAADHMLVIAYEAVNEQVIPDEWIVDNGAVCLWLTIDQDGDGAWRWDEEKKAAAHGGTVRDLLERVGR
jgi:3-oxoacyl-[acyl-carrier-protein] synthase II